MNLEINAIFNDMTETNIKNPHTITPANDFIYADRKLDFR